MPEKDRRSLFEQWLPPEASLQAVKRPPTEQFFLTNEERILLTENAPIEIGVMNAWPPIDYVNDQGKPIGIGANFIEAINLRLDGALKIIPGSWDFIYAEYHPFTVSSHPSCCNLRVTVKALGDYTSKLQSSLHEGVSSSIQGPYGMFNFKNGKYKKQLWIAGGIGITPFLSFITEVDENYHVTLIWTVKTLGEASYQDELNSAIKHKPNVRILIHDTETKNHFSIENHYNSVNLADTTAFICGPEGMRYGFIEQLLKKRVSINDIHFEEFSFR
ncbi:MULTISPECIES: hypothetical protein [unclassified Oceanispirochaeta]|uniref:hypothetical protein n=1 Tax=unclassified Oceanispirochaeta TaxID=2635722 RepID=UPI000E09562F|nr:MULTISPECIES: hypothetical protein [unclassified Oceanispirochaeta]MBF9013999.1 hypothetical protein [Oceanispirochaeta sp. M2]NPD70490.1 hypothetical protein [Oceanispirochaeta sp. M1]RDG34259.1 hypothetical protein DV872_00130 [Oceanispirochaeta sp. M1]